MKKLYTLLSFALLFTAANATVVVVTANANFTFTPSIITVQCLDTVRWNWVGGIHNTTSNTIPTCATSWAAPLTSTSTTFQYQVPCAGNYFYGCTFHPNMTGQIICVCTSGMNTLNQLSSFNVGPNPFGNTVKVKYENVDAVRIFNVLGAEMKSVSLDAQISTLELDLSALRPGVYFFSVMREGIVTETKKLVKE